MIEKLLRNNGTKADLEKDLRNINTSIVAVDEANS